MRSAEEILKDANNGDLLLNEIKIKETARLTIIDKVTGEVTETIISETPRTLIRTDDGHLALS